MIQYFPLSIIVLIHLAAPDKIPHPSFLKSTYKVYGNNERFFVRQVPGNGACLFNAIAAAVRYKICLQHLDFDITMKDISSTLRKISVLVLMQDNASLVMADNENITTTALLTLASESYNMTQKNYLMTMLHPRTWGGGPEIVALSNYLERPICVYQLCMNGIFGRQSTFELKLAGRFGPEPAGEKSPLYILCADGRFPNVQPGQHKEVGDHFLALFPCRSPRISSLLRRRNSYSDTQNSMRGGDRNGVGLLSWLRNIFPWMANCDKKDAEFDDVMEPEMLSFMQDNRLVDLAARLETLRFSDDENNRKGVQEGLRTSSTQQGSLPCSACSDEHTMLPSSGDYAR